MKEFFENLKNIRLQKKISLDEISVKTRLPLGHLEKIESGKLDELPQGYRRIFFKRYLKEIGEDKAEVWQDFNLFFGKGPLEDVPPPDSSPQSQAPPAEIGEEETPVNPESDKASFFQEISVRWNLDKMHKYFWVGLAVVVLGFVGFFAYKQYIFVKKSQIQIKEVTLSDFIEEMQKQDSLVTPGIRQTNLSNANQNGIFSVELKAVARTWVREIRDKQDTSDYILPAGLQRKIKAQESVQFMLGRADGVEVWLNGQNLGIMGDADEVVLSLVVNKNGIIEKKLKKTSKNSTSVEDSTSVPQETKPLSEEAGRQENSSDRNEL